MYKLLIRKRQGKMLLFDKDLFANAWGDLEDGDYHFLIKKATKGTSRNKFYWDCVLWCILSQAGEFFIIGDRKPDSEEDIHLVLKLKYNPIEIIDTFTGEITRVPGTTKTLTDSEFIGKYEEQIIADFSGPPFLVEFPTFDQWVEMIKKDEWHERKYNDYGDKA